MAHPKDDKNGRVAGVATATTEPTQEVRPLPLIDEVNRAYWHGGADGRLHIYRCQSCGNFFSPPMPVCRRCHSRDVAAEPVSGRGEVYAYTVNEHPWLPAFPPPYIIALIELVEQDGLRVLSNIVDCEIDEVRVGLPVTVAFVEQEDVYIPVFRPPSSSEVQATPVSFLAPRTRRTDSKETRDDQTIRE